VLTGVCPAYSGCRPTYLAHTQVQHLAFSPEFTAAVEAKQVAQQEAQRAAFVVDKARQEKQAMVVKAQGEARSAELIGEAIKKNKAYVELKKLENARAIAGFMQDAGGRNRLLLDSEGLGLNVFEERESGTGK
jgi:prohibitin 2